MISEATLARIEAVLDRIAGLDALWVFGSEASGRATARSDLDLGALFASRPSPEALLAAREEIAEIVGRSVDLVDLESASPVLAMQVLRHGNLVAQRSETHRVRFMAALPGRYEDVRLLQSRVERLLVARLSGRQT